MPVYCENGFKLPIRDSGAGQLTTESRICKHTPTSLGPPRPEQSARSKTNPVHAGLFWHMEQHSSLPLTRWSQGS